MPLGPGPTEPRLGTKSLVTRDGTTLPLWIWRPSGAEAGGESGKARAVLLAVHSFNDYSKSFEAPAAWFAERGFLTYAYDQRGFGEAPHVGLWAGTDRLVEDLVDAIALVRRRHPDVPLFLFGESMGGALVVVTMARAAPAGVEGVILSAPAVWGRHTMPWYQRATLWFVETFTPWISTTGRGLKIQASDNIEALRALGRDPLVIKDTEAVAISGLTDLMTEALLHAPELKAPALVLYGEKDQVIPSEPTLRFWRDLPAGCAGRQRKALYANGWHLLLRDLERETVYRDILFWIEAPDRPLPSGMDRGALARLMALAGGAASDSRAVLDGQVVC